MPSAVDSKSVLDRAGLAAKKSWGQNFLRDQNILRQIAATAAIGPLQPCVELGAGVGALTQHLLERGAPLTAVERDRDLIPVLRDLFGENPSFSLLEADAAEIDYPALAARSGERLVVAGNLPYHLSGRILVAVADNVAAIRRAVFLVQREVAQRLAAAPGGREYGLLTVLVQRHFTVEVVRQVPPGAFHPPPKVKSAVVRLDAKAEVAGPKIDAALVATARAAFSTRRKTLRNALKRSLGSPSAVVEAALAEAGLAGSNRAEQLAIADFARLGVALQAAGLLDGARR